MTDESLIFTLILGIILSAAAALLFSLGVIMQKKAVSEMMDIKLNEMDSIKDMLKNRVWVIGILCALSGGIPYIISVVFIGVALAQPMMLGFQLIFVVLLALKKLDEHLEQIEKLGFLLLLFSPIFLALGDVSAPNVIINSNGFINGITIFFIPTMVLLLLCFVLSKKYQEYEATHGILMALISGIFFAIGAVLNQIGVQIFQYEISLLFLALILILGMMVTNTIATGIQQIAFQKGKVGIAIGLQSTTNLILAVFGGIVAFNQLIRNSLFFIFGIIMIISGNFLLIQFQARLEKIDNTMGSNTEMVQNYGTSNK